MKQASSPEGSIQIRGARQNNLKDVDVTIAGDSLTVITGVSGSGKSSLAFDTLYAEGQRRYVESLSAYARQFLERLQKPLVREVVGIRPAIAIRQKNSTRNPRSTVGTVTEVYDYLRLLFSRAGTIFCRGCGREVKKDTVDEAVAQLAALPQGTRLHLCFPFAGSHLDLRGEDGKSGIPLRAMIDNMVKQGFQRLLSEGDPTPRQVALKPPGSIEELVSSRVLVDRLAVGPELSPERLADSLETCFAEGGGVAEAHLLPRDASEEVEVRRFTERFECQYCGIAYRSPEPALFSFNNPYGACPTCQGFGNTISLDPDLVVPNPELTIREGPIDPFTKPRYRRFQEKLEQWAQRRDVDLDTPYRELPEAAREEIWRGKGNFPGVLGFFSRLEKKKYKMHVRIFVSRYRGYTRCPDCKGERLCREALDVRVGGRRISQLTCLPIGEARGFFEGLRLEGGRGRVAERLLEEIKRRLDFLVKVGLSYLSLDRLTSTLSGGEMQRIHLAASLGSSLVGALYVLDEPSVGLHPRDESRLIEILRDLRDLGNTIVVVEHERDMIESADQIIDVGPGAGERGGEIVHSGDLPSLLANPRSLTGKYLSHELRIPTPVFRRGNSGASLVIRGARQHNLANLTVKIPLGVLVCVTGVSGSGKSTLVNRVLYAGLKRLRGEWKDEVGDFDAIEGWEIPGEALLIDQSPIGKTPRSNPVTYIKAFDDIRQIFASLREAENRNLGPGAFSFNIPGGRCEACQGAGVVTVEMQFLADVELVCEDCKGTRFQNRVLELRYKGRNIAETLEMTVDEALEHFRTHRSLCRKLKVLREVGLGYLRLGQSATTLSGGEAQRIKLASYLGKKTAKNPLFIFDEPTTGLHFDDVSKLLAAFNRLTATGASVIVIEHNLDVVKCADWVIDLGPEGGKEGGRLVAEGPPEAIARSQVSHTGRFLRRALEASSACQGAGPGEGG